MLRIKLKDLIKLVGGKVCHGDIEKYKDMLITRVSFDSRDVDGNTVFTPLIGEKVDAHKFISQVLKTDCVASFTQKPFEELESDGLDDTDHIIIFVNDCIKAVHKLAYEYRNSLNIPIVGITGSVGKTTTRQMVALALSAEKKVYATKGNRNSQVGTPQTLFEFDDEADIAVLEMGMSMPGEMENLANMVRPDCAVFTNVGVTHIENLGSREAILNEKLHITDHMVLGSPLFINYDNDMLRGATLPENVVPVTYGMDRSCNVYAKDIDLDKGYPSFVAVVNNKEVKIDLHVYGTYQVYNTLAALAVADHYGVDLEAAAKKLSGFEGFEHRGKIFHNNRITVIDDTYNAAPDSMKGALDMLSNIKCSGRRIAVLADMKELGDITKEAHLEIGRYSASMAKVDVMITYGEMAKDIDAGFDSKDSIHTDTPEELIQVLFDTIKQDDLVLFKGSNSMRMFDFVDKVIEHEFM